MKGWKLALAILCGVYLILPEGINIVGGLNLSQEFIYFISAMGVIGFTVLSIMN